MGEHRKSIRAAEARRKRSVRRASSYIVSVKGWGHFVEPNEIDGYLKALRHRGVRKFTVETLFER